MKKLIEENPHSKQGLLLRSILSKACIETPKPKSTSFWYVTVQGNNHVLADAVGLIKSKIPDYVNGLTSPKNWLNEREVSVGMWEEKEARVVQRFLSGHGFETSLIKAENCH